MNPSASSHDVLVIGAGHAGCEAAHAAARLGCATGLVTPSSGSVARMSCNPAVGGLAKGHLVREIDALGGLMGRVTDQAGIQFRLLNRSRGPAVQAPRAQVDKALYHTLMLDELKRLAGLELIEGMVASLDVAGGRVEGVTLADGRRLRARCVVVTTGTFLRGMIHIGLEQFPAGRLGEAPALDLAVRLEQLGFEVGRLKTGTPPRLLKSTVDFSRFAPQPGDAEPVPFSFGTGPIATEQVPCHIAFTSEATHAVIRESLGQSPLFTGRIEGVGPRYCPSIEDKVVRFADRTRHQIFIEPEGRDHDEIYLNGLSTSLPRAAQRRLIDSIEGLTGAEIVRPGYAIEYDFIPPTALRASLETWRIEGLFLAGQIDGTTGYEEAAALGIMAGVNAARSVRGKDPLILGRHEAYTGVLIDDLVTRGTREPYRMFTSRAEHRLLLGIESADERLTPHGRSLGLVGDEAFERFQRKYDRVNRAMAWLGEGGQARLTRPGVTYDLAARPGSLREHGAPDGLTPGEKALIESRVKYRGYVEQQTRELQRVGKDASRRIPREFAYDRVPGLSREIVEKLSRLRPATLGQAGRVSGVTPAAVAVLRIYVQRAG